MEKWAFTIKYNPNGLTSDDYKAKIEHMLDKWRDNGVQIIKLVYEDQDKKGIQTKLHAHGLIAIKRGLYRRKLMIDDYHVKLVAYYSTNWDDYCNKNSIKGLILKIKEGACPAAPPSLITHHVIFEEAPDNDNPITIPKRSLFQ